MRFIILIISLLAISQLAAQNAPLPQEAEPQKRRNSFPDLDKKQMDRFAQVEELAHIDFKKCAGELVERERDKCHRAELTKLLNAEIKYPEEAKKKKIKGNVVISFIVSKNGKTSNFELVEDIGGGCGKEALRALKAVCQRYIWVPKTVNRKAVIARYYFSFEFK